MVGSSRIGSVEEMLSRMKVGICTPDFSLVYDLVKVLNERGMDYVLISPKELVDRRLDVVVIEGPKPRFLGAGPPFVRPLKDPVMTIDRAVSVARGVFGPDRMVLGVDPGVRTGVAVLSDGVELRTWTTMDPLSIRRSLRSLKVSLRPKNVLVRIGNGDPARRDHIISILAGTNARVEIVDEASTSIVPRRTHEDAALRIARMRGVPVGPQRRGVDNNE